MFRWLEELVDLTVSLKVLRAASRRWADYHLERLSFGKIIIWEDYHLGRLSFGKIIIWEDYHLGSLTI